jgi:diguanylate cyclase (GGDEF)-like protein
MASLVGLTLADSGTHARPGAEGALIVAGASCVVLYVVALIELCRALLPLARRRRLEAIAFPLLALAATAIGITVVEGRGLLVPPGHLPRLFEAGAIGQAFLFALALAERTRARSALVAVDGLTGIPNRRSFDKTLTDAWKRARRSGGRLGLLMIDVDAFKRFNDAYGHQAGDDVLRRVAHAVAGAALRGDDLAARYGGEEFVIVLPLADGESAQMVGERVRENVHEAAIPYRDSPAGIVTVSVGAASIDPREADASALVALADQALYQAKREGRDRVVLAMPERSTLSPAFR